MSFKQTTLGEYAKVQGGYAYKSSDFAEGEGCIVLKIKNVRFGHVDYSEPSYIDQQLADETKEWKTKEGDILISMTGSGPNAPQSLVGRVARVWKDEPSAWINQRVGRVVLKDVTSIHPDFLFYLLSTSKSQDFLVSNSSGSANQANISGKIIESLPCPKVDFQTSARIVEILRSLDEKILLNRQINQTLEQIAQAMFKTWFVDFEPTRAKIAAKEAGGDQAAIEQAAMCAISGKTPDQLNQSPPETLAQLKATAALFPEALVDSGLGEIPEGWEVKKIEDILVRLKPSTRYGNTEVLPYGKVPVYEQGTGILLGYHNEVAGFDASPEAPIFIFGDHTCVTHLSCEPFDVSQNVIPLSGKNFPTAWVYYAIQGRQEFQEYRRHWSELIIKEIVVPTNDISVIFSKKITKLYLHKEHLVRESKSLEQIRNSLLPKLLSGELAPDGKLDLPV
ncbi:restriction endonuclease subunit S [Undibacterium danionis]|uniref:Restriction endonuclease subunit S n=1 Tax=Undibacterium danionis TaxID=1812100 RepID=A0ABV6IBA6_9BURK